MTSYQPKALPLGDDGFVRSFTLGDDQQMCPDALAFFDEFGFCVVDSVLSHAEQVDTINDIWSVVEGFCGGRFNIHRDDPPSWRQRWPGGGPGLLGQAVTPHAWLNRANPNLRAVFEGVIGRGDLVCSVDNYGLLRPTRLIPTQRLPPQIPCRTDVVGDDGEGDGQGEDMDGWKTKSKWLHWDLSPFHWVAQTMPPYTFSPYSLISENNGTPLEPGAKCKVQGLLNLVDARVQDGGFLCIPGFHKHLAEWIALPENQAYGEDMADAFDYLEVPAGDPMQAWTTAVPMRAGSLLVWNSELPHCNFPNDSDRFRMVQYVKCFPRPPPATTAKGGGGSLTKEKTRAEVVEGLVRKSLGSERICALSDDQFAILGLHE